MYINLTFSQVFRRGALNQQRILRSGWTEGLRELILVLRVAQKIRIEELLILFKKLLCFSVKQYTNLMRKIKSSKSEELLTMSQIVGLFVNAGISKSLKLQICWPEEKKCETEQTIGP